MTIETEVAALTTQTTALLSAVNVKKSTLDAAAALAANQVTLATNQVTLAAAQASQAATQAFAASNSAGASSGSAAQALAIFSNTAAMNAAVTQATTQANSAATSANSAASVLQQDLSAVSAALHRSPNAITASFIYDTSSDSDGGAWVERMQDKSWATEALSGAWLTGGFATELAARQVVGATTGSFYQLNTTGAFFAINKNLLLNTATLGTQSVFLAAGTYTLSGATAATGSVALTGAATGTFTAPTALTFTVATSGNVTFTVTGSVTTAQLEPGSAATVYAANTAARITETTRGNTAKFPRLSAIVADAGNVTIYDLTAAGRPMWMRLRAAYSANPVMLASSNAIASLVAVNGVLAVGSTGAFGLTLLSFLADNSLTYRSTAGQAFNGNIAQRNEERGLLLRTSISSIVNSHVNAVAMTVLPDAPIDVTTGLQIPTIAVGTAGGVSVIKHDGTVANHAFTTTVFDDVAFSGARLLYGHAVEIAGVRIIKVADIAGASFIGTPTSANVTSGVPSYRIAPSRVDGLVATRQLSGSVGRLHQLRLNYSTPGVSLRADVAGTFNTGWMTGDIRRAYMADTVVESIAATELVTNGGFDSSVSWTLGAGITIAAGELVFATADAVPGATNTGSVVLGRVYEGTFTVSGFVSGGVSLCQGAGLVSIGIVASANGIYRQIFTASASDVIGVRARLSATSLRIDNVTVKEVVADRSYKAAGANIFGTLVKSQVAAAAQLVAFSGFSAANYLQEPYSADLDFGVGDWTAAAWIRYPSTRINLLTKTDQITDAIWSKTASGTGVTPVVTDNYLGENGVTRLQLNRGAGGVVGDISMITQIIVSTTGLNYFASVDVKATAAGDIGKVIVQRGAAGTGYRAITLTADWQTFGGVDVAVGTTATLDVGLRGTTVSSSTADLLVRAFQHVLGSTAAPYQRVNTAADYDGYNVTLAERAAATGPSIKLGIQGDRLIATAFDGTTTRTVTSAAAYATNTWLKVRAGYVAGRLAIMVNGAEVASATGAALLTLNNATATLTIGNNRAVTEPFLGSIALVKLGATIPTTEQAQFMFAQEANMFRDGAQITLPAATAVTDLAYDDSQDKWVAQQAGFESSFTGLVRTATAAPSAGTFSGVRARSGVKLSARATTAPGVDVTIPAYGLREELIRRGERAAALSKPVTSFDLDTASFTATTTAGSNVLTLVASVVGTPTVGMGVTGAGIPVGATIRVINGANYTLSANATATATLVAIGQATFTLPAGYTAQAVLSAGARQREGATRQFTRQFDGFRETILFGTAPGSAVWVQINAVRDL